MTAILLYKYTINNSNGQNEQCPLVAAPCNNSSLKSCCFCHFYISVVLDRSGCEAH